MIIDTRQLPQDSAIDADLCIIGAGPAGVTIAMALDRTKISVCLLESGGHEHEERTQSLYQGEYAGNIPTVDSNYLHNTRYRYFGGTSNVWGGYCRPLEAIDFEQRDWVPNSGWPFPKSHLDPYYRSASEFMRMGTFDEDNPERDDPNFPSQFGGDVFDDKVFRFRATRFGREYRQRIADSSNISLYLYANAIEIVANRSGADIEGIDVATLSGKRARVKARYYVLATGAIENARLLLASRRVHEKGLGNQHGLVGRYFMEHAVIHYGLGPLVVWGDIPMNLYRARCYDDDNERRAQFVYPSLDSIRTNKMLTVTLDLHLLEDAITDFDQAIIKASFDVDRGHDKHDDPQMFRTIYMCEQAPSPANRVTLTGDKDELGMPRVKLQWSLADLETKTIYRFARLLTQWVGERSYGRVKLPVPEEVLLQTMSWGCHHMGTTRMHRDPKQGVVDENCRVHGVDNLLVAGSSVYPTSGAANPTFTIIALALRMVDDLKTNPGLGL